MGYYLNPFSHISAYNFGIKVENGLAVASSDFEPIQQGKFNAVYERDQGTINSDTLAGMFANPAILNALNRTPGKYTGEMRKVVQALLSTGVPVMYRYEWGTCHGVGTAPDGSKWLIEISGSGVRAMALPVRTPTQSEHAWLGYTPDYEPNLFQTEISLLTSGDMSSFYAKTPYFLACGWAFNADGTAASNTAYSVDGGGNYTSHVYDIIITYSATAPLSATIAEVQSGRFRFGINQGFKVPDPTELYVQSFICDSGTAPDDDVPVYVFYDGLTKKYVNAYNHPTKVVNHSDTVPNPAWFYATQGFPDELGDYGGTYHTSGSTNVTEVGCYVDGFAKSGSETGIKESYHYVSSTLPNQVGDRSGYWYNNCYKLSVTREYKSGMAKVSTMFCIIPIGDREAVYQLRTEKIQSTVWTFRETINDAVYSDEWVFYVGTSQGGEDCSRGAADGTSPDPRLATNNLYFAGQVGVGTTKCPSNTVIVPTIDNVINTDQSGTIEKEGQLNIVASGGVNQQMFIDNTMDENNEYSEQRFDQYMTFTADCANGEYFCSETMNAINGPGYFISSGVDIGTYPVGSVAAGYNRFWIGEP